MAFGGRTPSVLALDLGKSITGGVARALNQLERDEVEHYAELARLRVDPLLHRTAVEDLTGDSLRRAKQIADLLSGHAPLDLPVDVARRLSRGLTVGRE